MPGLDIATHLDLDIKTSTDSAKVQLELGIVAYCRGNDGLAFRYFQSAADKGLAQAQYYVGLIYEEGNCFNREAKSHESLLKQAAYWYKSAADKGVPEAQNNLGQLLEQGKGVSKNLWMAATMYRLSAIQGFLPGLNNLARVSEHGRGVKKNEQIAAECYRRIAKKGEAEAQFKFASFLLEGKGVEKNEHRALKWCQRAAKQGHPQAIGKLEQLRTEQSKAILLARARELASKRLPKSVPVVTPGVDPHCALS